MEICWIKAGGLLPLDLGGRIRSFQILTRLARRHEVTLLTFYHELPDDPHPSLKSQFARVELHPLRLPKARSLPDFLLYASKSLDPHPYSMAKYYSSVLRRSVRELCRAGSFAVIVCDFIYPAGLLDWETPVPKVIFTHNVEAEVWQRQYRIARNPVWRLASWLEYRAMARAERRYLRLADHVLAVSERNREFFSRYIPAEKISVVPTGVDTGYFHPDSEAEMDGHVVFTGSMDWLPNHDAVQWYHHDILPLIRRASPGVVSWMVGRGPARRTRAQYPVGRYPARFLLAGPSPLQRSRPPPTPGFIRPAIGRNRL